MTSTQRLKGIILAGGSGSRLYPVTRSVSKQLLPVFDKPMIYYPLSTLMLAGIRDVLVITTPHEQELFRRLLDDGSSLGLSISTQRNRSLKDWRRRSSSAATSSVPDRVALALGDNIFYGAHFSDYLRSAAGRTLGRHRLCVPRATIPERYGVVEFDSSGRAVGIEEKPSAPKSPFAVTGLYFYDNRVLDIAASLRPSARGELEITDVNRASILKRGELHVERLARGIAWLDTGTHAVAERRRPASSRRLEERQGLMVACLEEIAYRMNYITAADLERWRRAMATSSYGQYLLQVLEEDA